MPTADEIIEQIKTDHEEVKDISCIFDKLLQRYMAKAHMKNDGSCAATGSSRDEAVRLLQTSVAAYLKSR